MRIHASARLNQTDLGRAADIARVQIEHLSEHGSRSRDHAFDVKLTGLSRRRPNGGNYGAGDGYAATWDQWGVFMGYLLTVDESVLFGKEDAAAFDHRTDGRFTLDFTEPIPFPLDHDHRFKYAGTPRTFECSKCGAVQRWDY